MRNFKTDVIIIKRNNFSEADRIITALSKNHGKIKILAKGVRKINSRRCGNVELFNVASITLHQGKNFDILTEACVTENFSNLKKDLKKIGWAYYICELVDGLCPEKQENRTIFEITLKTFTLINTLPSDKIETIIENFENIILKELGFWPKDKILPQNLKENFIENILEKRLKSKQFLKKIC